MQKHQRVTRYIFTDLQTFVSKISTNLKGMEKTKCSNSPKLHNKFKKRGKCMLSSSKAVDQQFNQKFNGIPSLVFRRSAPSYSKCFRSIYCRLVDLSDIDYRIKSVMSLLINAYRNKSIILIWKIQLKYEFWINNDGNVIPNRVKISSNGKDEDEKEEEEK